MTPHSCAAEDSITGMGVDRIGLGHSRAGQHRAGTDDRCAENRFLDHSNSFRLRRVARHRLDAQNIMSDRR